MDDFLVKIKMLTDILEKKENDLSAIYNITVNQRSILLSKIKEEKEEEISSFYKNMNSEKQDLIDKVIKSDELFQNIFEKLDDIFEKKAKQYKDEVKYMQEIIKNITGLDVKIRVEEKRNHLLISSPSNKKDGKMNTLPKNEILKKYSESKNLKNQGIND